MAPPTGRRFLHMVQEHPTWVLEESEQGWDDFHPAKGWPAASTIHRVTRQPQACTDPCRCSFRAPDRAELAIGDTCGSATQRLTVSRFLSPARCVRTRSAAPIVECRQP
jgi:hypothetical protein